MDNSTLHRYTILNAQHFLSCAFNNTIIVYSDDVTY